MQAAVWLKQGAAGEPEEQAPLHSSARVENAQFLRLPKTEQEGGIQGAVAGPSHEPGLCVRTLTSLARLCRPELQRRHRQSRRCCMASTGPAAARSRASQAQTLLLSVPTATSVPHLPEKPHHEHHCLPMMSQFSSLHPVPCLVLRSVLQKSSERGYSSSFPLLAPADPFPGLYPRFTHCCQNLSRLSLPVSPKKSPCSP